MTWKAAGLRAVPPGVVTLTVLVLASTGTAVTVSWVPAMFTVNEPAGAGSSPKRTLVAPPRLVPLMRSWLPTAPLGVLKFVMVGAARGVIVSEPLPAAGATL